MPRPNIVVVLSDQQRWDTVDCYGSPIFPGLTPNLDAMAARGVRFQRAFTMQPVCGPARSCLQSGLYATETGCHTNGRRLPVDQVTIAKLLSEAGYETSYIGKWHLAFGGEGDTNYLGPIPPERRGGYRDYWLASEILEFTSHGYEGYFWDGDQRRVDFEGYRADAQTRFVLDYLRQYRARGAGRPFLLFVSYIEPHHQNDLNRYIGPMGSKQRFADYRVPADLAGTDGDWRQHLPDYLGCCWSLDENLGRIRSELDALGLADNTLVIYTSDHGCHFRTRNAEYKRSPHESSIRVPLIAHGPGFTGGMVRDGLASLLDVPATVLRAGGVAVPASFRGRPLHDLVAGAPDWRTDVFIQVSEDHIGRAIRTDRWKYSVWAPSARPYTGQEPPGSERYAEQCLYDLHADPHERDNRVGDPALSPVRAELSALLRRRMVEAGEAEPLIVPAGS